MAAFIILGLQVWGFRRLEAAITGFVAVIVFAFGLNLLRAARRGRGGARACSCPQLAGSESALLAVGIIGATVMPHVIYLHSSLTQKRIVGANPAARRKIFRYEIVDITIAMGLAGIINLAMLATAAAVFHSRGMFGVGNDLGQVFTGLNRYLGGTAGRSSAWPCSPPGSPPPAWARCPARWSCRASSTARSRSSPAAPSP